MRTGAVRSNLVESETRMTWRALAMIACATFTSRKSKSSKRAVLVDRRGADHRIVDLELPDEIDRRLADDAAVGAAHDAAGDHHLDRRVDAHHVGNIDVIGDDHQPAMVEQRRATASVVVPILMNSEALSGMSRAAARPIASFSSPAILRRAS